MNSLGTKKRMSHDALNRWVCDRSLPQTVSLQATWAPESHQLMTDLVFTFTNFYLLFFLKCITIGIS